MQFNETAFIASPGEPDGVDNFLTTTDGYTWLAIANAVNAMIPYDSTQYPPPSNQGTFFAGAFTVTPPEGVIKVTALYKGQYMKFFATENNMPSAPSINRYFLTDPFGNRYIMHASPSSTAAGTQAAFESAVLPDGWTKEIHPLSETFTLEPSTGPNYTYFYYVLRDSADCSYHQISWGTSGITLASQVSESGLPIWGGRTDDTIKITQSFDNLIYGGGGANVFDFSASLTAGTNTIIGFNGDAGDRLNFNAQTYTTLVAPQGTQFNLSNGATVLLQGVFAFDTQWVIE